MRKMYSEEQIRKIAGQSGGAVSSVNGKTGEVVLSASDINATNAQSIQANLERIDLEVEGLVDDVADLDSGKLDASKAAIATVGGLVIPSTTPVNEELVGIDTNGDQQRVTIGNNLSLVDGVLSATGGSELTPQALAEVLEGSNTVVVDLNQEEDKLQVSLDQDVTDAITQAQGDATLAQSMAQSASNSAEAAWSLANNKLDATKCTYQTTAPTAPITDGGVHIVVLTAEPSTYYLGYVYLIKE